MKKILVAMAVVTFGLFIFIGAPTVNASITKSVNNVAVVDMTPDTQSDFDGPSFDGDKSKKSKKRSSSCQPSNCKPSGPGCAPSGDKKCGTPGTQSTSGTSAPAKSCCAAKK